MHEASLCHVRALDRFECMRFCPFLGSDGCLWGVVYEALFSADNATRLTWPPCMPLKPDRPGDGLAQLLNRSA